MRFSFSIALLCLLFVACKKNKTQEENLAGIFFDQDVPGDFLEFYLRFHQDSIYQIEHVDFPLSGIPNLAFDMPEDSLSNFTWEKEDWKLHKAFNYSDEYAREYIKYSDELIGEIIYEKETGYGIERRFSKNSTGWKLIYYIGMNKVN